MCVRVCVRVCVRACVCVCVCKDMRALVLHTYVGGQTVLHSSGGTGLGLNTVTVVAALIP